MFPVRLLTPNRLVAIGLSVTAFALAQTGVLGGWLDLGPGPAAALGVLIIAAVLWISEAVPLFLTSFVVLALSQTWLISRMGESAPPPSAFLTPFFSDIILLFLGGFALSAAMHRHRLDEMIARRVIALSGGSTGALIAAIMGVTAFLSMWLSNTATTSMMMALTLPIALSLPAGDPGRKAIILAVPFAANIGGIGTPIGTPPNAIAVQYIVAGGGEVSFAGWMLFAVPLALAGLTVAWATLRALFRGGRPRVDMRPAPAAQRPSPGAVWSVVVVGLATAAGWLTEPLHGLSTGTVALLPIVAFFGLGVLRPADFRDLSWDVLFVMGGGLCLGRVIDAGGLADVLVQRLPVGELGFAAIALVVGVTACFMSTLMSNTATANLLMPIVAGFALGAERTPAILTIVAVCCSMAMALPISTPPNAIAFSSGEIRSIDLLRPGLLISLVGTALAVTLGPWWWGVVRSLGV